MNDLRSVHSHLINSMSEQCRQIKIAFYHTSEDTGGNIFYEKNQATFNVLTTDTLNNFVDNFVGNEEFIKEYSSKESFDIDYYRDFEFADNRCYFAIRSGDTEK